MSLYTRDGDTGETSLVGGLRVPKDSLRIEVYGTLDEVTSTLGLARATTRFDDLVRDVSALQAELIEVMSELASGPQASAAQVGEPEVARLEATIDRYQAERLPCKQFVRPGGSKAGAAFDMARTFVRRAERRLVTLARQEAINPQLVKYFNRLSDLFFIMARIDEQREVTKLVTAQLASFATPVETKFGLNACTALLAAGRAHAESLGVAMVLAATDEAGRLIALMRMDGALPISLQLAPMKAHTAAAVRMATHEFAALALPGGPLFGIDANLTGITLVGGGLPLIRDGQVVGAVGASGGAVEQDIDAARAMAAAFALQSKETE